MKEEQKQLSDEQAQGIWDKALKAAFESEGIKVNRESYLSERSNVPNCETIDEEICQSELQILIEDIDNALEQQGISITSVSFPGIDQTVFSDILNRTFKYIQKMLYDRGLTELWLNDNFDELVEFLLVVLLGVMYDITIDITGTSVNLKKLSEPYCDIVSSRDNNELDNGIIYKDSYMSTVRNKIGVKYTQHIYSVFSHREIMKYGTDFINRKKSLKEFIRDMIIPSIH